MLFAVYTCLEHVGVDHHGIGAHAPPKVQDGLMETRLWPSPSSNYLKVESKTRIIRMIIKSLHQNASSIHDPICCLHGPLAPKIRQ